MTAELTHARLLEVIRYEPTTGAFTRLQCKQRPDRLGLRDSTTDAWHYPRMTIDGRRYYMHRLAFFYMTGEWPADEIDHKYGDHQDLRWDSLRPASRRMNSQNKRGPRADNNSGYLGVSWDSARARWAARIKVKGRYLFLGRFDAIEAAATAYVNAKRQHHEGCTI